MLSIDTFSVLLNYIEIFTRSPSCHEGEFTFSIEAASTEPTAKTDKTN